MLALWPKAWRIILMSDPNNSPLVSSPAKAEQIIEFCRQKFINILPNSSPAQDRKPEASKPLEAPKNQAHLTSISVAYKKEEIKTLMRQLSIFLQLVIQNCLLSSDHRIKTESYRILGHFRNLLSRDLQDFETLIYNKTRGRLSFYENDCREIVNRSLVLKMPPQVSLYQDPLLFYIYTRQAQEELFTSHSVHVSREEKIEILKNHSPFLNGLFVPIVSERLETKAKFSELEDRLLCILVKSKLQVSEYRPIYFPHRAESQIKNRIKNLCCNSKEVVNPIKEIKQNEFLPLSQHEIKRAAAAFRKLSSRWPVISKYYQLRSPEFLEAEYSDCEKLKKRRDKEKIKTPYSISFKQMMEKETASVDQRAGLQEDHQGAPIESERLPDDKQKHQQAYSEDSSGNHLMEEEGMAIEEEAPLYKIINNVTFQYQEI